MVLLSEFEKLVLPEVLYCPGITAIHAIRQSIIDFCEDTWLFSKSFNETVAAANIDSSLNDSIDINVGEYVTDKIPVAVADFLINGTSWGLKYMSLENETSYINSLRDSDQKLFSFPDNSTFRVHETSDGDEIFLKVIYKPTYEIMEIDDIIYNDWVEVIIAGAKMRLLVIPDQPWSNGKLAAHYSGVYKRGISEAKRKVQKSYTQEPKHVKYRAFGA